jgi:hypothetical protein
LEPAEAARFCTTAARLLAQALEKETNADARRSLAAGLASVAGRLGPAEAARVLAQALEKETDAGARPFLSGGLASVAGRLEPAEAARVCAAVARVLPQALEMRRNADARQALEEEEAYAYDSQFLAAVLASVADRLGPAEPARVLIQALEKETLGFARKGWASGLASVAGRLGPAEAARVLAQALDKETDAGARESLASGLASVAGRLGPAEAARVCAAAARLLAQALEKETNFYVRRSLAACLAPVAGRLEPAEAARALTQALKKETDAFARQLLAEGLASVASRLGPAEGARIGNEVLRSQLRRLKPDSKAIPLADIPIDYSELKVVLTLLPLVDAESVEPFVLTLSRQIASDRQADAGTLELLLTDAAPLPVRQRIVALAAAVGQGAGGPLAGLTFLPAAREPLPCRLATQDLVELLKMPTCLREVRRVVLDQLGNRYGRRFETHWDFVRFAQEQNLGLNFTTPPQRPDRKLPPLFVE